MNHAKFQNCIFQQYINWMWTVVYAVNYFSNYNVVDLICNVRIYVWHSQGAGILEKIMLF